MYIEYNHFIKETVQFCKNKRTGCVTYTSDKGEAGQIFIKSGRIVALEYAGLTGVNSLPKMVDISRINDHQFKELPVIITPEAGFPDTKTLLQALLQRKAIAHDSQREGERARKSSKKINDSSASSFSEPDSVVSSESLTQATLISAQQKQAIKKSLLSIIGPMAEFLAEEHVDEAESIEAALQGLQQDIDEDSYFQLRQSLENLV